MLKYLLRDEILPELCPETQELIRDIIALNRRINDILTYNEQLREQVHTGKIKVRYQGRKLKIRSLS
ncbi:MAG: hypothetical protein ACOWWO_17020 [Peptococcaceae bacterium]